VTDRQPADASDPAPAFETSALLDRLPGVTAWDLTVKEAVDLTPSMRRLRLGGAGLSRLTYAPGQDVMVAVPGASGGHFRRRYTIRRLDRASETVDLEIVVHGDGSSLGPGARWAARARPGDRLEALGPRGKITVHEGADWHLFAGDESALPAMAAMAESLPAGSRAIVVLEVAGAEDEQSIEVVPAVDVDLIWLHRIGEPGTGTALPDALERLVLPPGVGHAYLAGELKTVAAMRKVLLGLGLEPDQLSPKPYWRKGKANAAHGELDRER
jgi:NADPH-dependent ferric siderophore reductase